MGRWRPPAEKSSPYITAEGYQRLNDELKYLWKSKRPEVTQALSEAAAEGDRSENAEYIYRKKELREIDRRVRYLSKRLDGIKVVEHLPNDQNRIFFGAWVTLIDDEEKERTYRIVGADEIDPKLGYISVDSPIARLMLKKEVGDEVEFTTPEGEQRWYEILCIRY
ncbi:MAG TPA: transcription elongation factor GreB [Marinobacterium sp.]|nr:transcription elongation factor GreB [Marinobacterium sp.]